MYTAQFAVQCCLYYLCFVSAPLFHWGFVVCLFLAGVLCELFVVAWSSRIVPIMFNVRVWPCLCALRQNTYSRDIPYDSVRISSFPFLLLARKGPYMWHHHHHTIIRLNPSFSLGRIKSKMRTGLVNPSGNVRMINNLQNPRSTSEPRNVIAHTN